MGIKVNTILFIAAVIASAPADAADITGRASVVDGDTIEIQGQRIRFNGVDAPESRQTCTASTGRTYMCGRASAAALDDYLSRSRPTRCEATGKDRYNRVVANCFRADGQSVSAWMVRSGFALDWPRYSKGAFAFDQASAKAAKAGIWQGEFTLPWEWRRR